MIPLHIWPTLIRSVTLINYAPPPHIWPTLISSVTIINDDPPRINDKWSTLISSVTVICRHHHLGGFCKNLKHKGWTEKRYSQVLLLPADIWQSKWEMQWGEDMWIFLPEELSLKKPALCVAVVDACCCNSCECTFVQASVLHVHCNFFIFLFVLNNFN